MPSAVVPPIRSSTPTRAFGNFVLQRLLAKSALTMAWLATDQRTGAEAMLSMPRHSPAGSAGVGQWLLAARRAARLDHPSIAPVAECGVHEHWPYVAVDRRAGVTLAEWLAQHPAPPVEDAARWIGAVLRGLAFGHDAGIAHLDIDLHHIVVNERGQATVMGFAVAVADGAQADVVPVRARPGGATPPAFSPSRGSPGATPLPATPLRALRTAAERDVLACGVMLHRLLSGPAGAGDADVCATIERMAPLGRELVRLPWTTPQPVAEPLRAIVNRSTSGQVRLRYRNARTFLGALTGWLEAASAEEGGPVTLLLDRLHSVGHLPALPGLATRVKRITAIESQRTDEIARHLLPDMALSFELLKTFSSARVQGTQIPGNGPVLTLRRIVALIGVDGVREAANRLRIWPGPLDDDGAHALRRTIDRTRLAGHLAQSLRPAGYDGEAVYLVAVLQNLGRLLLRYHFADEAEQIAELSRPLAAEGEGESSVEQPGLDEAGAAYAVLGVEIDAFGSAAARQWGLNEEILHMIRRLPTEVPVRKPDDDSELLRIVASAANEIVDALDLPAPKVAQALNEVIARYARTLRLTTQIVKDGVREAKTAAAGEGAAASAARADDSDGADGEASMPSTVDAAGATSALPALDATAAPLLDREQHG